MILYFSGTGNSLAIARKIAEVLDEQVMPLTEAVQQDLTSEKRIGLVFPSQTHFDAYNTRFFDGALPPLPIRLSHAKGFLGKLTFTRRKQGLFRGYHNENFVLRINVRIDYPEELLQDTILHEMIHYYIAVNQWRDTSTHGQLFRREMARINAEGNRHISISHRLTEEQRKQVV